ncbi:hypothetical protein BGX31_011005 [Mortierella sp. GBA43]|nr:hypothetical protein BGX31_011005 [Mortierella sp. GBA43]
MNGIQARGYRTIDNGKQKTFRNCLEAISNCLELRQLRITRIWGHWRIFGKELKLKFETPGHIQVEIIRRCPQLRDLTWHTPKSNPVPITDVVEMFKTHCPLVEQLTLIVRFWSDQDISQILDSCGQLTSFNLFPGEYWTASSLDKTSKSLVRHFSSLRELKVYDVKLTSKAIQNIMTKCPKLRVLKGAKIEASDILGISKGEEVIGQATRIQHQLQDWTCTNLRYLDVFICGLEEKPREWHQRVFEQLSRLTRLEKLSVGEYSSFVESRDGLDLRLEAGLGALKSLKQLQELRFPGLQQKMGERDALAAGKSMDLHDIRMAVAPFLSSSDLAVAVLVCKSWNASFIPLLYSTIQWRDGDRELPDKSGILKNVSHIRHLGIFSEPPTMFSDNCTNLRSLYISIGAWEQDYSCSRIKTILQNNPGIKSITMSSTRTSIHRTNGYGMQNIFRNCSEVVSSFLGLEELRIIRYGLDPSTMDFIFDTAVRLERLSLKGSGYTSGSLEKWPCFPTLKELNLDLETPSHILIEIIRRCPKLRVLDWNPPKNQAVPIIDVVDIFKTHCPLIEELTLTARFLSDEDISEILDNCGQLTSLTLLHGEDWILSLDRTSESLARHFSSLRELEVSSVNKLTSETIQDIMTNCPNLRSLKGGRIEASDILDISKYEEIIYQATRMQPRPQDWTCTNLQHLEVFICGLEDKPLEWHRRVFEQLSRLTRLEKLYIGDISSFTEYRGGLDLRLEAGLGALKSLRQLKELRFWGLWQKMREGDVKWMLDTWPRLRVIDGRVHHDDEQQSKLRGILSQAGVKVPFL